MAGEGDSTVIQMEWFTVEEAAKYLRVSRRTIYKWTKEGKLPTYIIGDRRHRRYRKSDLDNVPRLARIDNGSANSNNRIFGAKDEPSSSI